MEIYIGEYKEVNIQDCEPFFKQMVLSSLDELNDRNNQTRTVRNGQIVETSKGLLWFATVEMVGAPPTSPSLGDFARSIPAGDLAQDDRAYTQEFTDEVAPGTTAAGRITVYCAEKTTAFADPKAKQKTKKGKTFSLEAIAPWNWF